MPRRPLRVRDATVLAGAAALVVALPALANGFTYDDVWLVQNHPVVHSPGSLRALLTATFWPPTDGVGALWRPVTLGAFAAQWAAGGGAPLLFHAVTIGLSVAAAALVAAVSGALFGPVVALVAGLLFAVHPVHVEVTATVVGQAELWAAIGYLGAVWATWRAAGGAPGAWVALVAGAMILGLGAKEHVITLPAAVPLVWWWRASRDARPLRDVARAQAPVLLATLALAFAYLLVRRQILGDAVNAGGGLASGLDPGSPVQRTLVMLPLSLRWLELLFVPVRLSADYSPRHVVPDPTIGVPHVVALIVWVLVAVAAWRARRAVPAAAFGAALFGITVAIVSNVPVPLEVLLAERLLYLPSAAWAMAIGGIAAALPARNRWQVMALGAVIVLFGARSIARAAVWRSNTTLFAQMAREAPNSFRTHWVLGSEAFSRGDSVAGEREWREAIRLNPDHPQLLEDLGRVYAQSGLWEPAIPLLDRAVQLDSTRLGTGLLLASALSRAGHPADALRVLDAMERLHDGGAALRVLRADVHRKAGDFRKALAAAREAVARDSTAWRLWVFAAETATLLGDCPAVAELVGGARRHAGEGAAGAVDTALAAVVNRKGPCN
jgi:Tetratricopeptide repeat